MRTEVGSDAFGFADRFSFPPPPLLPFVLLIVPRADLALADLPALDFVFARTFFPFAAFVFAGFVRPAFSVFFAFVSFFALVPGRRLLAADFVAVFFLFFLGI